MKVFFLRTVFLFILVFLQISFFGIIFPWFRAPLFLSGVIVAMTLVRSFPGALVMVLPLSLMYDIASSGTVTWFSVYAIFISYVTSFMLRRLMLDHQGLGLGLYGLVSYGITLFYQGIFFGFVYHESVIDPTTLISNSPSVESLVFSLIFFLPVFAITYYMLRRFEDYIELINQRQFRGIR